MTRPVATGSDKGEVGTAGRGSHLVNLDALVSSRGPLGSGESGEAAAVLALVLRRVISRRPAIRL